MPERDRPWSSVCCRFVKWRDEGIIKAILPILALDAGLGNISLDSASVKVHPSVEGGTARSLKRPGASRAD